MLAKEIKEELIKLKEEYGDSVVIEQLERNVLQVKNPELSYFFATKIKGADVKAHEQVVIDSKNQNIIIGTLMILKEQM